MRVCLCVCMCVCSVRIIIDGEVYCVYLLHRQRVNVLTTNTTISAFRRSPPPPLLPNCTARLFVLYRYFFTPYRVFQCGKLAHTFMKSAKNEKSMSVCVCVTVRAMVLQAQYDGITTYVATTALQIVCLFWYVPTIFSCEIKFIANDTFCSVRRWWHGQKATVIRHQNSQTYSRRADVCEHIENNGKMIMLMQCRTARQCTHTAHSACDGDCECK